MQARAVDVKLLTQPLMLSSIYHLLNCICDYYHTSVMIIDTGGGSIYHLTGPETGICYVETKC